MSRQLNYVIQDESGRTVRYLNWQDGPLSAVWLPQNSRLEFTSDIEAFSRQNKKFEVIETWQKSKISADGAAIQVPKRSEKLYIKAVPAVAEVRDDAPVSESKEKPLALLLKYTAAVHIAVLGLVFVLAWVTARFFSHTPAPVTVQVFSQQDLQKFQAPTPVVNVADHKITRAERRRMMHEHVYTSHRTRHARSRRAYYAGSRHGHGYGRAGTSSVASAGALGVLGGMGPQYHGSGGLNVHAKGNNPGIGYGGPAMRGGFERGLLGKGLIATGIGDGSSLQGYGGKSRHGGLGGGAPGFGYGRMHMAGSSAAYFEPLAEDSLVEGGLDRDQINSVIQRNLGEVTYCYEEGLQSRPHLSGRVAVHFVIGSRGYVTTARVANTSLDSPKVESCIVQKLRGWKFPRPTGNVSVRVTYPFVLKRLSEG